MPTADTWAAMQIFFNHVEHALESLPNGVVDNVKVNGEFRVTDTAWVAGETNEQLETNAAEALSGALDGGEEDKNSLYINVTFNGPNVQGFQNPLTVKHIFCNDGCTPKLTGVDLVHNTMNTTEIVLADYNSFECGRRGKCDYKSGICDCFSGYSGLACGTITSLV